MNICQQAVVCEAVDLVALREDELQGCRMQWLS